MTSYKRYEIATKKSIDEEKMLWIRERNKPLGNNKSRFVEATEVLYPLLVESYTVFANGLSNVTRRRRALFYEVQKLKDLELFFGLPN